MYDSNQRDQKERKKEENKLYEKLDEAKRLFISNVFHTIGSIEKLKLLKTMRIDVKEVK
jgi:hypothetical protein